MQVEFEEAATVAAGAVEAYTVVADVRRRPEWMAELESVDAPDGAVGRGSRFTGEARLLLHRFLGDSEILEAEPGRVLVEQVVIGARFTSTWSFEPVGDGATRVRHRVAIDFPRGAFGWVERAALRWRLRRMLRASLKRLGKTTAASSRRA